jgi:hypothetical protein
MTLRVSCEVRPRVANRSRRSYSKNDPGEFYKRSPVFDFSGNSGRRQPVSYSFEAEFTRREGLDCRSRGARPVWVRPNGVLRRKSNPAPRADTEKVNMYDDEEVAHASSADSAVPSGTPSRLSCGSPARFERQTGSKRCPFSRFRTNLEFSTQRPCAFLHASNANPLNRAQAF